MTVQRARTRPTWWSVSLRAVLIGLYVPWWFFGFEIEYAVMYSPLPIRLAASYGYYAVYGGLCYIVLRAYRSGAIPWTLIVPLPWLIFLVIEDPESLGEGWYGYFLPMLGHGAGILVVMLLSLVVPVIRRHASGAAIPRKSTPRSSSNSKQQE